jgi:DNA polymerase
MNLYLDCETYNTEQLNGVHRYAETAEVMLRAWALDDGPVQLWDLTAGQPAPAALQAALADRDAVVWAHNAQFDRVILREVLGLDIPLARWRCSAGKRHRYGTRAGGLWK